MFPLEREFGLTELRRKCDNTTSRIVGFIIYTRSHSYIVKTLRDIDFWNELDEISGPRWPIFAVRPLKDGHYYVKDQTIAGTKWVEPNDNRKYLDVFSLDESRDLPCFVAFIWNDDDEIEQTTCKLSNRSLEAAFDSIREIVSIISEAERQIHPKYRRSVNVFRNVKGDINSYMLHKKIKRRFRYFQYIRDFISTH